MITDQIPQAPLGTQMNLLKGGGAVILQVKSGRTYTSFNCKP